MLRHISRLHYVLANVTAACRMALDRVDLRRIASHTNTNASANATANANTDTDTDTDMYTSKTKDNRYDCNRQRHDCGHTIARIPGARGCCGAGPTGGGVPGSSV